jgi:hypothetical protein
MNDQTQTQMTKIPPVKNVYSLVRKEEPGSNAEESSKEGNSNVDNDDAYPICPS